MGTSAFDKLWADATPQRRAGDFDALWGDDAPVSPTQAKVRQALKTPEGKRRLEQGNREQFEAEMPTLTDALVRPVTESFETVAAGIPGAKLAISGYRNLLKPSASLADIQREVNAETSDVPYASAIGRAAGSLPAFGRGSMAAQGAKIGAAEQLLNNDADASLGSRIARGVAGAAVGGVVGKGTEMAATGVRALLAKPLGANALARQAKTQAVSGANYGKAAQEGEAFTAAHPEPKAEPLGAARSASGKLSNLRKASDEDIAREYAKLIDANAEDAGQAATYRKFEGWGDGELKPGFASTKGQAYAKGRMAARDNSLAKLEFELRRREISNEDALWMANKDKFDFGEFAMAKEAPENARKGLRDVLMSPTVAPYTRQVLSSETHAGADEATVLREAYKLMSEAQRKKMAVGQRGDFAAATDLQLKDIGLAKERLLAAADEVMPSLRKAITEHAKMAGETDAFQQGSDVARRVLGNGQVAGKKLTKNSAESLEQRLAKMSPEEASAAGEGILGRTKERAHLTANPLGLFGVPTSLTRMSRAGPLLRAADKASGSKAGKVSKESQRSLMALLNALSNP